MVEARPGQGRRETLIAEPLAFGLVGLVVGSVNRWLNSPDSAVVGGSTRRLLVGVHLGGAEDRTAEAGMSLTDRTPVDDLV